MARFNENVFEGSVFGLWTILKRIKNSDGRAICCCKCGTRRAVKLASLINGRSSCCGCLRRQGSKYATVVRGRVFGRLTVIRRLKFKNGFLTPHVLCKCICGNKTKSNIDGLLRGSIKSCGCLSSHKTTQRNKTNAKFESFSAKAPNTYRSWRSMLNRCYNSKQKSFKQYGKKGVIVCRFLRKSPQNLVSVIGYGSKVTPSLDRFPIHDGNYTCGQCKECKKNGWGLNIRWATRKEQSSNRGKFNVWLEVFGKKLIMEDWSRISGIDAECIRKRLKRGWSHEKAVTTPDKKGNCL